MPLLFAVAIEALATPVGASVSIQGFQYGDVCEKLLLYAYDMLLLFGDTVSSLQAVMDIIGEFGSYSGLTINCSMSASLVLDGSVAPTLPLFCPVPVVSNFKYLGIVIFREVMEFCGAKC